MMINSIREIEQNIKCLEGFLEKEENEFERIAIKDAIVELKKRKDAKIIEYIHHYPNADNSYYV